MLLIYDIALWLAAPFITAYHLYRSLSRGRPPAFKERFGEIPAQRLTGLTKGRTIWVHAVSVGETIAVRPLLKALKERYPDYGIILSNVTETGRRIAEKTPEVDHCIYLPFDFRFAVDKSLKQVSPSLVVIMETELWPNFLSAARTMGIPTVLVNGRISDRSFGRYLRLRWFFRPVLANLSSLCMQTEEDARRIIAIGADPERVRVAGNLKYDIRLEPPGEERKRALRREYHLPEGVFVITAGSTHAGEEQAILSTYLRLLTTERSCLLVLAPRHPERAAEVGDIVAGFGMRCTLRSRLAGRGEAFAPGEVLLVDTVGELTNCYAISSLVFVGGSLVPTGGHNVLEPASLGVAVVFGPHMENFREAAALMLEYGGGVQVRNSEELNSVMQQLMDDGGRRESLGTNGMRLIREKRGAVGLQMEVIEKYLRSKG